VVGRGKIRLKGLDRKLLVPIALCFLASVLCFLDRVNISVAAPAMMQHFGWDESRMGLVFSAFFAGYVIFMIPGGIMADRYGARPVLIGAVLFWSLFTFVNPFFATIGTVSLCRYLIGTGQAVFWPAVNSLVARRVPLYHRAKVLGFILSGVTVGSIIGFPLGSWIIKVWGWPAVFYSFGLIGFLWTVLWMTTFPRQEGGAAEQGARNHETIPWKRFLTHSSAMGLALSYFCHNYGGYLFLVWMPTYLMKAHGFSLTAMGIGAALPSLAAGISMNLSGWLSDYLIGRGYSREFSRKLLLFAGMGGSGMLLGTLIWADNPVLAVVLLTFSSAAKGLSTPVYWALSADMAPRHAGVLSSIMNTLGNVAGIVASILTGWIVARFASWNGAILVGALITLAGVAIAAPTVRSDEIS